jgi:hypothetical protein
MELDRVCPKRGCKHIPTGPQKHCLYHLEQARVQAKNYEQSSHGKIKRKNRLNRKTNKNSSQLISSIASKLLYSCKFRVKDRNEGKVLITHTWIKDILTLGYCQSSFPPLKFIFDEPGSPFSPSLDRIDSSNRDYSPENTRIVCYGINVSRNNFKDKDILSICDSLSAFIRLSQKKS